MTDSRGPRRFPSASSGCSEGSASEMGASMPAARREVPPPTVPRSSTRDADPARRRPPGDGETDDAAADDHDVS